MVVTIYCGSDCIIWWAAGWKNEHTVQTIIQFTSRLATFPTKILNNGWNNWRRGLDGDSAYIEGEWEVLRLSYGILSKTSTTIPSWILFGILSCERILNGEVSLRTISHVKTSIKSRIPYLFDQESLWLQSYILSFLLMTTYALLISSEEP